MKIPRKVLFDTMRLDDIQQVLAIDHQSFPLPWSATSYHYELTQNDAAHFYVAVALPPTMPLQWLFKAWQRPEPPRLIVGYCGYWFIIDEAHISTLAVMPKWRGLGVGEALLRHTLNAAIGRGAVVASLEVRVSNTAAQKLYLKYGFEVVGERKRYYRDNSEDALLMTAKLSEPFPEPPVVARLET